MCYLQDLYADPEVRGRGVGRALIEAIYAAADAEGAQGVYWLTQDFNAPRAQALRSHRPAHALRQVRAWLGAWPSSSRSALSAAGCAVAPDPMRTEIRPEATRRAAPEGALPPMRVFGGAPAPLPLPPNAVAGAGLHGPDLPHGKAARACPCSPATRSRSGSASRAPPPPTLERDPRRACCAVCGARRASTSSRARGAQANVVIETVPLRTMRRLVPQAACFVVPNVGLLGRVPAACAARTPRTGRGSRGARAPRSSCPTPSRRRSCATACTRRLAQAVGPLGDLWRLPGSVFNDDNLPGRADRRRHARPARDLRARSGLGHERG